MLVNEQYRRCVVFLCVDASGVKKPIGTGFLVSVPVGEPDYHAIYVVTAKHVVDLSRPSGPVYLRFNTPSGEPKYVPTVQDDDWIVHPTADVAVASIHASALPQRHGFKWIPNNIFVSSSFSVNPPIGLGDDVFFTGLFIQHPGQSKNLPIVRFGNISLLPEERITVWVGEGSSKTRMEIDAYLVEARSWGGHSGSPAFVYFPADRKPGKIDLGRRNWVGLLGLVSAHFEIAEQVEFAGDVWGSGKVKLNAGMAVVTPAEKILEVLMGEPLASHREARKKAAENDRGAG